MQHAPFCHLHVHSYYSLLESAVPIDALIKRAHDLHMPALALTDKANLFAAVDFYTYAEAKGIKPIIGAELYVVNEGSYTERKGGRMGQGVSTIILLAKNRAGYENICQLLTRAHFEGFYYRPRIDKALLEAHKEGVVALSGGFWGEVGQYLAQERPGDASIAAKWYQSLFGDDFYLELVRDGIPQHDKVASLMMALSNETGISTVATGDVHFLDPKKGELCKVLSAIRTGNMLSDEEGMSSDVALHFRTPDEMIELFADAPEAVANTLVIAEKCNFEFDFKTYHFPKFTVPDGTSLEATLETMSREGFEKRWKVVEATSQHGSFTRDDYVKRLDLELALINKMGFAGYFLIVSDFINHAKKEHIPVGPGRGSAAGSLVAFSLGITDIDPMPHALLFERFLNPERISMPDMDIDFCMRRRDEVIRYVSEKYGHVSQIITFGKMKAKAVLRDVGRVLGIAYGDVDRIAKLVPTTLGITLEGALKLEPQLKKAAEKDPTIRRLLDIAQDLEGYPRHASTHAAGVVISDKPLDRFLPLYKGQHDEVTTQFDMKGVEKIGLIKFDFLGLKTLTVIHDALTLIKQTRGEEIDISLIPLDDADVYAMLSEGDTQAVFQLESGGMTDLIVKLKPNTFEDIVALVALFRPGPLGSGMVDDFINRKHGRTPIEYELPQLETILKDTYGVIVYQEQVMQIASALAGFTLGDADILRRAMGKKKPEEMAKQREKFLIGAKQHQIPDVKAEKIFDLMAMFAEYGFNKSHSAAYALVSYQTAYLKAKYRTEYMAAVMTNEMGNTDKILSYINDCKSMDIQVSPPSINDSFSDFTVLGPNRIGFGLAAVKNVGVAAIEAVVAERANGPFVSLLDFCERADSRKVNRRVIESLIKCGAFDFCGRTRAAMFEALDRVMEQGAVRQKDRAMGQVSMFDLIGTSGGEDPVSTAIPEWDDHEKLGFEKESLGFYVSGHPLSQQADMIRLYTTASAATLSEVGDKTEVKVAGMSAALREVTTKKGDRMGFVTLEDLTGAIDVVVFPDVYQTALPLIKADRPLFVIGQADVSEESVKIIAKEIIDLDEVPAKRTASVHFRVRAHEASGDQLDQLKALLGRFPGSTPTYLHVVIPDKSETVLKLPDIYKVSPSSTLSQSVDGLFGHRVTELRPVS